MKVSSQYEMVMNLRHAADDHKRTCDSDQCNVSLGSLRRAAETLIKLAPASEQADLREYLNEWPH